MATFPERALAWVNATAVAVADLLLAPAVRMAPLAALVLVSAATGIVMLWVVRRTSNQAGMAAEKRAIQAGLLEMRLFNDSLPAVLRALLHVLGHNARYVGYTLVPLAWMTLPLVLLIAQLQAFYGYTGLRAGEPALLVLRLQDAMGTPEAASASLDAPDAIRVDTPAVVLPGAREIAWRVTPVADGEHVVAARLGASRLDKSLHVGASAARRSPRRVAGDLLSQLLYPSEPPLPATGPAAEFRVTYPDAGIDVFGWSMPWLLVFIVVSMITAFALARRLGVVL